MTDINQPDIRRLDGGLLLVFREVLRTRSATEAARRLFLSQSAVSHALGRLRDLFSDPLFVRRSHGLEPTRRALELGPRIEALIDLANEALQGRGGFNPARSERRFTLGAPQFLAALIAGPMARNIKKHAPRVSFQVLHLVPASALDLLRRGELDLALGRFGDLHRDGLDIEALYEDRYCVVARRRHPALKGKITPQQYAEVGHVLTFLLGEGDPDEALPEPKMLAAAALVPGWVLALLVVASSDAIATCPARLAESYARKLNLQVLDLPFDYPAFTVSVARRAGVEDPGIGWLQDQVRRSVPA